MEIRITLYDEQGLMSYSQKETRFYGKDEEFYNKLVEYAELLQCKEQSLPPSKEEVKEEQGFANTGLDDYLTNIEKEEKEVK